MVIARVVVLALLAAGCRQLAGLDDPLPRDGGGAGGDGDGTDDGSVSGACYGNGLVRICLATEPSDDRTLTGQLDTGTSPLCALATDVTSGGAGVCIVAGARLTVPAATTLRVVGTRPLVLIAQETITIAGTVDAASHRGQPAGPAANFSGCIGGSSPGSNGGGAGGSFAGVGGAGGGPNQSAAGGSLPSPTMLHGGCPGTDGAGEGSTPGAGGGAVYLIARTAIDVAGSINASGAGTDRDDDSASAGGGSGGGSGGMIGLDAPSVNVAGIVFANGGGGAEGDDASPGRTGADPIGGAAGSGGTGSSSGGAGGNGGAGAVADGGAGAAGLPGVSGGGGGGGSVGIILLFGTRIGTGTISPPAS